MNCHEARSVLHAYMDGELQAPATMQYEEHLSECPACSQMLAEQKELQACLKSDALYYKAPEPWRERLRTSLHGRHGERKRRFPWRWVAAAACLVFCFSAGFILAQIVPALSPNDRLAQEVVSSHIRSLQVEKARLVDKHSSNRHEVKPWFNDKLDFSPSVPDLSKQDFELVGGRMDYLDGRPVAALVYKRRQHLINVFVWPDAANRETQLKRESRQGFHLLSWSSGGMKHWVVSDLNADELDEFAQALN